MSSNICTPILVQDNRERENQEKSLISTAKFSSISTLTSTTKTPTTINPTVSKNTELRECLWALEYPEVQKACYLSRVCTSSPPRCCQIKAIPSILQDGPTCGLTAVSMIFNGNPTTSELLDIGKGKQFTNNGEMFSAENLYNLIHEVSTKHNTPIECQLHEGRLNCAKVKDDIKNGSCILVPYDPDFNHGPCLKMGHKAHWALLIGYLINEDNEFYVFSRHGKTRNIAVWSLKALGASNANLEEFAQPKGYPNMDFLLPEGGLAGEHGLKNKAIIVKNINAEIIQIV